VSNSAVDRTAPRIAVTGAGLATPYGSGVARNWAALLAGRRAVRSLTPAEIGAPCAAAALPEPAATTATPWAGAPLAWSPGDVPCGVRDGGVDPVLPAALLAAAEAVAQSGLLPAGIDHERLGCVFGTSKGGLAEAGRMTLSLRTGGPSPGTAGRRSDAAAEAVSGCPALDAPDAASRPREFESRSGSASQWASGSLFELVAPSLAAIALARRWDVRGPLLAPVAACATGLVALIRGAALIRDGACDAVIAGSSDASVLVPALASFRRLGVLAPPHRDPASACRPFDQDRAGFHVGEGAGCLILERWDHAVARGAPLLAEWCDGLQLGAPAGLAVLPDDPCDLVRLLRDLLARTGLEPRDIDAVSLHGTGTRLNDRYEAAALRAAFGPGDGLPPGFSVKGGIGHLLGAAGSVETVFSLCALQSQLVPPTINCDRPADDCAIPVAGPTPQPRRLRRLLKLSLGFGGHLAAAILADVPAGGADWNAAVRSRR